LEWSAHIAAVAIERKRAEEALANEASRRRIYIEQSWDGIVVIDEHGSVFEFNPRFAQMLGYTPEETHRLHVWDWDKICDQELHLQTIQSLKRINVH
jgi:PAS domain S-box-containing protein